MSSDLLGQRVNEPITAEHDLGVTVGNPLIAFHQIQGLAFDHVLLRKDINKDRWKRSILDHGRGNMQVELTTILVFQV